MNKSLSGTRMDPRLYFINTHWHRLSRWQQYQVYWRFRAGITWDRFKRSIRRRIDPGRRL